MAEKDKELKQEHEARIAAEIKLERLKEQSHREKTCQKQEFESKIAEDRRYFEHETEKVR